MGLRHIAALTACLAVLLAQQPVQTFRVDVRLVRMLVTVKDAKGDVIGTLDRGDFVVKDNDVEQELAVFEQQSTQPLSVALLFDTSLSTISDAKYKKASVQKFTGALLQQGHPHDTVSVFGFNDEVTQLTGFVRDAGKVQRAVDGMVARGGTALYDAVYLATRELDRRAGRRVIVAVSDGGDTASRVDFQKALESIHRVSAVFYSVLVVPIAADAGRNLRGEHALITLSSWTGGKVFFPTPGNALDRTFLDILRDLRTQYLLAYYPKNLPETRERFHRVKVEAKRPGLIVYSRNGYYGDAPTPEADRRDRGPALRPELP